MINTIKFEKYKYPITLGLLSQLVLILISIITLKTIDKNDSLWMTVISPSILIIFILYLFKKKEGENLKWIDFNIVSIINVTISSLVCLFLGMLIYEVKGGHVWKLFATPFVLNIIPTIIIGIFLEKSSTGLKLKRLLSVLLFVWTIYKLFTSFSNSDESETNSNGVDNDGDGVSDTFDSNGDGVMDTSYVDTDGDGISDTISKDSDGDGIVDTVFSDSNGDGKIDSFVKDSDGDGISDIGIFDSDGDGKTDKLV